jgi:membrane associated rhomboid family serine protease
MDYPVVSATAALATAVTVAWWAKIDVSVLFESPLVGRGQWWRLLTSALPHINVLHLIFNLSWLWVLGTKIERVLGHLSTLLLFRILAIGSGAFEYAFLGPGVGFPELATAFSVCFGFCPPAIRVSREPWTGRP